MKRDPKTPCAECVFRRDSKPGHEDIANMGGSAAQVYIGQAFGPFAMPCHCHCDFEDPKWRQKAFPGETPQCAGLAIFRANAGVDQRLPEPIARLPADHELVFSTAEEFTAHHLGITRETAYSLLRTPGFQIHELVKAELCKAGVIMKKA